MRPRCQHPVVAICFVVWTGAYAWCAPLFGDAGPDKLIEAVRYASFADDALQCRAKDINAPVAEAKRWTDLAIKTARALRTKDKVEQGRAAAFIAREVLQRSELETQSGAWDSAYKKALAEIKATRLSSAQTTITNARAPICDSRFRALEDRLGELNTQVDALIMQGDNVLESDRKTALKAYEQAQRINTEQISLVSKIASAKQQRRGTRPATTARRDPDLATLDLNHDARTQNVAIAQIEVSLYHKNKWCPGVLKIGAGWMSFERGASGPNDPLCFGVSSFRTTQDEVTSFGGNAIIGVAANGFHIKKRDGVSLNFSSAQSRRAILDSLGQGFPSIRR